MSWLKQATGGDAPEPYREPSEDRKVKDPSIPNRMVSNKPANRPFLAYKEYREKQEALHAAWEERQKEREAKIARGEKVGPPERDPTAQTEVGMLGLLKFFLYLLIFTALAGKFITGSYTWEYQSKWTQLKTYWPTNQRLFSERLLAEHDGSVIGRPIYLAARQSYQPGGSYAILAGVDAARSFGTGCFKTHRTHDLRGLTERELKSVAHWKKFYAEHKDYVKIGRVSHPPIDPDSPIPEHCDPKKEAAAQAARQAAKERKRVESDHQEL
ncbi:hypothetical protein D9615_000060 [Tricholomella constricta]|uniref:Cytochrome b5 heme-binding domain-containing protein n=1 Tax=Tricholomella constricta TaxID=117010 RepID=A0A8H5HQK3_9AGAR|nr:hypothetical protein D9615_000060 [Tricholomella constricta]